MFPGAFHREYTIKRFNVSETFEIRSQGPVWVEGFEESGHPGIPHRKAYVFRREPLRDVLAFLEEAHGDGLYVSGPTGSGKTSLILQVAARLHWPVQAVTCHGRMELAELIVLAPREK